MNLEEMRAFSSEESLSEHREYLEKLRLKYSVLTKSDSRLSGLSLFELLRKFPKSDIKDEAVSLMSRIFAHELFFDSFSSHRALRERIGRFSVGSYLFFLYRKASAADCGILYIYPDLGFEIIPECQPPRALPVLCIDLYEHAYFQDYRFDRQRYIEAALSHLNLDRFEK